MKNMFTMLFLSLIASQTVIALDLHTDPACALLKTAIQQAQPLERVQDAWNNLVKNHTVSIQDKAHLASQLVAYAQEQKETLEQELTTLGDTTYNPSQLKWAAAQAAFGTWCIISFCKLLDNIKKKNNIGSDKINWILFPITSGLHTLDHNGAALTFALFGVAIDLTAPYFIYKAYCNLSEGLHYKNSIEAKIKNLTAAIEFLQQPSN